MSKQDELAIQDPVLLIRINRLYQPDMSADELYDCTRGVWVVGPRRDNAKYALAVYESEVLEVYEIDQCIPRVAHHTYLARSISIAMKADGSSLVARHGMTSARGMSENR